MMFLGMSAQAWDLIGWIVGFGVGFFLLNLIGDHTWRRRPPPTPAE